MNYNILRYVVTVAEEKNFTKAAEKLFIAQPSLSQIIKKEEDSLGVKLFDRNKKPLELTSAGNEYVLWARQIINSFDNMKRSMKDFSDNDTYLLKIGIMPEFSAFILAKPLKKFREEKPKAVVQIHELSSSDLVKSLENSDLDFIVGLTHPDKYKYISEPLYDEKIVLAVTPDYLPQNYNTKKVNLKQFSNAPFVMMEKGQFLYNVTHHLCNRSGFVPKAVVECYNLETAFHMVKTGVGVSIVPDLMSDVVGELKYYEIEGATPESQVSIVYQRDRYLSDNTRLLIELIKQYSLENE
ncbi:LysR family transcriptional regulator [Gottschalkia acidurici]|uniref:LysR family transcriptional regulator n=1 Tax=Clostridium acidurici TaxID=1556 RepID=UPI0005A25110|nr:LysR family transcriptional regulator [Gottschalkia acidurici]